MNENRGKPVLAPRALELIMRDVLNGLEESVITAWLEAAPAGLEILSIDAPEEPTRGGEASGCGADVISLSHFRSARKRIDTLLPPQPAHRNR